MKTFAQVVAGRYNMESDDPAIPMIIQRYKTHLVTEYNAEKTPAPGEETVVLLEEAWDHVDGVLNAPTAQQIVSFEKWLDKTTTLQID